MDIPFKKHIARIIPVTLFLITIILFSGCTANNISVDIPEQFNNSIGMEFTLIPAGEFYMGTNSTPIVAFDDPMHKVTIDNAFYMAEYEVTQSQWAAIMNDDPSYFKGDELPVEQVSWYDAQEFIERLNEIENTDKYRLPTEAEWEYACRAGTSTDLSFTDEATDLDTYGWSDSYGWCALNSNSTTNPVGQKEPNSWGLYDMHGNVWEWVQDTWENNYEGAPADGSAWEEGDLSNRVGRGGSWMDGPNICKSHFRGSLDANSTSNVLGFRVVKDI
ncbi:Formylglycine-generating enzyme, required for sulfatase activity, contains SUMF1/FGE domain [Methanolobus profundi]|uniref:Formylglycine-generating enzyme, required for sulfatase activity, contains SUMF1/FGE domain n=1 Tax=Methanolobus profundi TaxID=487685 RepID=A0A1I4PC27_9EURY|nr:Formylglycine-generating enzyme, required for sulfatase activity, contains SUMF1/FGE domain [Methanolobus profundi]